MTLNHFDVHMDLAVALCRRRRRQQQAADAGLMASREQQLQTHLYVLRQLAPLSISSFREAYHV